jgi:hypothetical protein
MSKVDPREALFEHKDWRWLWTILIWNLVAVIVGSAIILAWPAWSLEHAWDHQSDLSKWFDTLHVPDDPIPPKSLCCGKSDAYKIEIVRDAIGSDGDDMGIARVTDGAEIHFKDGTIRPGIPNGTEFKFSKSKINPLSDGNPTDTAWAFFRIWERPVTNEKYIGHVYCVIQLPPGS